MRLCPQSRRPGCSARRAARGYVLITLILFVALLAIGLTALTPVLTQQIKRDREEELIHRGTQYSRAIKHYMKKFNSYPVSIEALEKTNEVRFLRKRYKDPITGKDFKLLHQGEVQMSSFGPGIAGANSVASLAAGAGAAGNGGATPFGGSGVFGSNSGGAFGGNSGGAFGGNSGGAFGGNSGGAFGGNSGGIFGGSAPNAPAGGGAGQTSNVDNGSDAAPNQGAPGAPGGQGGFGQPVQNLAGFNQQGSGNQVFGGGPVVGVASTSKEKTIRVFSKKDHYKDWQFVYDPTTDRGGLITTPNQPPLQTASPNLNGTRAAPGTPGANGTPGAPGSPFGFGGGQQNPGGGMNPQQPQMPQMPPEQAPQ